MQHLIYWGPLRKPIEWSLKTVLAPWAYIASVIYHDSFWYPMNAERSIKQVLDSPWGRLFENWEHLTPDDNGFPDVGEAPAAVTRAGLRAFAQSVGILGTCIKEAPEFASRAKRRTRRGRFAMSDFNIRSESVDVEQIMKQIRARILEKRGVDYTEDQIRELATVRLEKFLDPKNLRSDLLEQFRKSRPAVDRPSRRRSRPPYAFDDQTLFASHRGAAAVHPQAADADPEAVLQPERAEPDPAHAGAVQRRHVEARVAPQDRSSIARARNGTRCITRCCTTSCSRPRATASR